MPSAQKSDPELIEAALGGSDRAWSDLVRRHAPLIWSVCRGCGLDRADAEDVSQVVFSTLVRRLPHLLDRSALSGWIVMTTKREAWRVSARKRRSGTATTEELESPLAPEPDPETHERQQAVREALSALDSTCRELLNRLFGRAKPLGYEAIAEELGISPNSVGPTRRRCLDKALSVLESRHQALFFS